MTTSVLQQLSYLRDGSAARRRGEIALARARYAQVIETAGAEPSLALAMAHRGLGDLEARAGRIREAQERFERALEVYRSVWQLRPDRLAAATEGEGAVLLELGDVLYRAGRVAQAEARYAQAEACYENLGDERGAEVWATAGRIAFRRGAVRSAERAFGRALAGYADGVDSVGQAEVYLSRSELRRGAHGRNAGLADAELALEHARATEDAELLARALFAVAATTRDDDHATLCLREAVGHAGRVGHTALAALALLVLGDHASRAGEPAERELLAAAQLLHDVGHYPGLGLATLRLGQHAIRIGDADLALAAAEAAWRVCRVTDPTAGMGQVLRVTVKAFTELRNGFGTFVAAHARAALVGELQPNAVRVREYYRSRAPKHWLLEVGRLSAEDLLRRSRRQLQAALDPVLGRYGLNPTSFRTAQGAIDFLGIISGVSPRAAANQYAPPQEEQTLQPSSLPEPEPLRAEAEPEALATVQVLKDKPAKLEPVQVDPSGTLAAWIASGVDRNQYEPVEVEPAPGLQLLAFASDAVDGLPDVTADAEWETVDETQEENFWGPANPFAARAMRSELRAQADGTWAELEVDSIELDGVTELEPISLEDDATEPADAWEEEETVRPESLDGGIAVTLADAEADALADEAMLADEVLAATPAAEPLDSDFDTATVTFTSDVTAIGTAEVDFTEATEAVMPHLASHGADADPQVGPPGMPIDMELPQSQPPAREAELADPVAADLDYLFDIPREPSLEESLEAQPEGTGEGAFTVGWLTPLGNVEDALGGSSPGMPNPDPLAAGYPTPAMTDDLGDAHLEPLSSELVHLSGFTDHSHPGFRLSEATLESMGGDETLGNGGRIPQTMELTPLVTMDGTWEDDLVFHTEDLEVDELVGLDADFGRDQSPAPAPVPQTPPPMPQETQRPEQAPTPAPQPQRPDQAPPARVGVAAILADFDLVPEATAEADDATKEHAEAVADDVTEEASKHADDRLPDPSGA